MAENSHPPSPTQPPPPRKVAKNYAELATWKPPGGGPPPSAFRRRGDNGSRGGNTRGHGHCRGRGGFELIRSRTTVTTLPTNPSPGPSIKSEPLINRNLNKPPGRQSHHSIRGRNSSRARGGIQLSYTMSKHPAKFRPETTSVPNKPNEQRELAANQRNLTTMLASPKMANSSSNSTFRNHGKGRSQRKSLTMTSPTPSTLSGSNGLQPSYAKLAASHLAPAKETQTQRGLQSTAPPRSTADQPGRGSSEMDTSPPPYNWLLEFKHGNKSSSHGDPHSTAEILTSSIYPSTSLDRQREESGQLHSGLSLPIAVHSPHHQPRSLSRRFAPRPLQERHNTTALMAAPLRPSVSSNSASGSRYFLTPAPLPPAQSLVGAGPHAQNTSSRSYRRLHGPPPLAPPRNPIALGKALATICGLLLIASSVEQQQAVLAQTLEGIILFIDVQEPYTFRLHPSVLEREIRNMHRLATNRVDVIRWGYEGTILGFILEVGRVYSEFFVDTNEMIEIARLYGGLWEVKERVRMAREATTEGRMQQERRWSGTT